MVALGEAQLLAEARSVAVTGGGRHASLREASLPPRNATTRQRGLAQQLPWGTGKPFSPLPFGISVGGYNPQATYIDSY